MGTTRITGRQTEIPHGTFYSLVTQAIVDTGAVQAVALEKEGDVELLTHSTITNNSRVTVPFTGSYEVLFSGIGNLDSGANKHLEIFYAIDGTPVDDSNTRVHIVTSSVEITVVASAILEMTAGQYVELYTWGDSTDCQWLATAAAAGPTRPAVPSMLVTVKMVSG